MISATTDPRKWKPGETMVWRAMEAASDYELEAAKQYSAELDRLIGVADTLLGKKTKKAEQHLSIEARMALHRIRGENVRMAPLAWTIGLGELLQKRLVVKKGKGWKEVAVKRSPQKKRPKKHSKGKESDTQCDYLTLR